MMKVLASFFTSFLSLFPDKRVKRSHGRIEAIEEGSWFDRRRDARRKMREEMLKMRKAQGIVQNQQRQRGGKSLSGGDAQASVSGGKRGNQFPFILFLIPENLCDRL